MCNIGRVDSKVFAMMENLEPRVGQEYMRNNYNHKGCNVLHMCHVLVCYKTAYDNSYLT